MSQLKEVEIFTIKPHPYFCVMCVWVRREQIFPRRPCYQRSYHCVSAWSLARLMRVVAACNLELVVCKSKPERILFKAR